MVNVSENVVSNLSLRVYILRRVCYKRSYESSRCWLRSNFETEQYILRVERISFTGGKKGRARILYIIVEVEYSKL